MLKPMTEQQYRARVREYRQWDDITKEQYTTFKQLCRVRDYLKGYRGKGNLQDAIALNRAICIIRNARDSVIQVRGIEY